MYIYFFKGRGGKSNLNRPLFHCTQTRYHLFLHMDKLLPAGTNGGFEGDLADHAVGTTQAARQVDDVAFLGKGQVMNR